MTDEDEFVERRQVNKDSVVLEKRLVKLIAGVLILSVLVGLTASASSLIIAIRVQNNTDSIREAGYQNCIRGNGVRAELQFRAGLTPPEAIPRIVKKLGLPKNVGEATIVSAVRKRLPVYDCGPLLRDKRARQLPVDAQEQYVHEFATGKVSIPPPP